MILSGRVQTLLVYSSSSLFLFIGIAFCFSIENAHDRKGGRNNRHAIFKLLFTIHLLVSYSAPSSCKFRFFFFLFFKKGIFVFLHSCLFVVKARMREGGRVWQWASGGARVQML